MGNRHEGPDDLALHAFTQADDGFVHGHGAVGNGDFHQPSVLAELGFRHHADAAAGGHDLAHGFAAFSLDAAGDADALAAGFLFQLGSGL